MISGKIYPYQIYSILNLYLFEPHYFKVNTAAVFTLRKLMNGLVCGPMDKNNGELWMVCPTLYKETVDKLFATKAAAEPEGPMSESSSNTKEIPLDCWDK